MAFPLTVDVKNKLLNIIPDESLDDVYIWHPASDGVYTSNLRSVGLMSSLIFKLLK